MKTEEKEKCFGAKCSNMFYKELIINNKTCTLKKYDIQIIRKLIFVLDESLFFQHLISWYFLF